MSRNTIEVVRDGLASGAVGFVTIALFFVAADAIAGRPFLYTPALLGGALFFGVRDPSEVTISPAPVLAYTAAHLVVFLGLGFLAARFSSVVSRYRHAWVLAVNLFILALAHASGVVLTLTERLQGEISAWLVAAATTAAAAVMAAWLLWTSPQLRRELRQPDEAEP